jgi:hypothetical protein
MRALLAEELPLSTLEEATSNPQRLPNLERRRSRAVLAVS